MTAKRTRKKGRGFTLAEMVIAVAISAALLSATAVAIDASIRAFTANADFADALTKTRLSIGRMVDEIRAGSAHVPITTASLNSFRAGTTVTDTGVRFTSNDGSTIEYRRNAAARTLELVRNGGTARTLMHNVDAFTLSLRPARSEAAVRTGGSYDLLERATLTLQVRSSANTAAQTLSVSVTPRAQLWG